MEITCGTDIIEIDRVKKSIERIGDKFLEKIYTQKEREYCESKHNQKYQHYAARFATKEAVYKAISNKIDEIKWNQIEVLNDKNGRPYVNFVDIEVPNMKQIDVSISHCKEYAICNTIITWIE